MTQICEAGAFFLLPGSPRNSPWPDVLPLSPLGRMDLDSPADW